ncbi:MAG: DNA-processing protein DprA [Clostridia bacterium]
MINCKKSSLILSEKMVSSNKAYKLFELFKSDENFFRYFCHNLKAELLLGSEKFNELCAVMNQNYYDNISNRYKSANIEWIVNGEADYPHSFAYIEDAPYILYYRGNKQFFNKKCFAIIGTRRSTSYGRKAAEWFSSELSSAGLIICGSGTEGIEYIAMKKAADLNGALIFMPCGLNSMTQAQLLTYNSYSNNNLLASSLPMDAVNQGFNIVQNNRLITGISEGILLVEAGENSGTMTLCNFAAEQGKEIFALPGEIFSFASKGTNALIRDMKAIMVTQPQDIYNSLNIVYKFNKQETSNTTQSLSEEENAIIDALENGSGHFDDIIERTKMPVSTLNSLLVCMEIMGYIKKLPSNYYKKV